jgi:replicative DNA helicase
MVFSLEMSKEQLMTRTLCSEARVDLNKIRVGGLQTDDWRKLTECSAWLCSLPLWVDDKSGMSPFEMRAKARRYKADMARRNSTLALVVVDYLQLSRAIAMLPRNASREQEVSLVSQLLKDMAKELKVPVLALAQLNRAVDKQKDKRPQLSDLRESGAIEQNADNVVFVHREEYYLKAKTPPNLQGRAEIIIEKQRNGPTGTHETNFRRQFALFTDSEGV